MADRPTWTVRLDDIEIAVTAKQVKHLRLVVHPDGQVRASVPKRTTRSATETFLRERLPWVHKQRARLAEVASPLERPITEGDQIPLWGELFTVHLTRGHRGARPSTVNKVSISVADPTNPAEVAEAVQALYRRELRAMLPDFVQQWSARLGLTPSRVTIRAMRTRWGSCTSETGAIRLNPDLASRHPRCLNYVVLHELVHLAEPNHGPGFQAMMDAHLPTWRDIRAELNGRV